MTHNKINTKGFTLVELVIAMAVIALILSIAIPNFQSMQQEAQFTKVEGELETLKVAVTSFWRHNAQSYPANVHAAITATVPAIITKALADPWNTDGTNKTYGYATANDSTYGDYFIIYSKGPKGDTSPSWNSTSGQVEYSGSGRVVSNAPVQKN